MSTKIRDEISKKNKWYVGKYRYMELKYFCRQYPEWKKEIGALYLSYPSLGYSKCPVIRGELPDPTFEAAVRVAEIKEKIKMVEMAARLADPVISKFILKGVTEGYSFPYLKTVMEIPCEKDMYYDRYRKFFYILSQKEQLL